MCTLNVRTNSTGPVAPSVSLLGKLLQALPGCTNYSWHTLAITDRIVAILDLAKNFLGFASKARQPSLQWRHIKRSNLSSSDSWLHYVMRQTFVTQPVTSLTRTTHLALEAIRVEIFSHGPQPRGGVLALLGHDRLLAVRALEGLLLGVVVLFKRKSTITTDDRVSQCSSYSPTYP